MTHEELIEQLLGGKVTYFERKAELPVLPAPVAQFNWAAGKFEWLQPYQYNWHNKQPLVRQIDTEAYGQQCAAQARELALSEAAKRMLAKAAELGIYNHHATKALVEALKGK